MSYRLRVETLREVASKKGDRSGYAIAQRSGISESTISRWLRQRVKPDLELLLKVAAAYDANVEDLIDRGAPV